MLKNLRIGTQIGMGFILIVAVSGLMVAYAIGELRTGSESFKNAMKGDKEKCLDAGMDGYVTKPVKSKLMLAEIARVLDAVPMGVDADSQPESIDDERV